MADSDQHTIPDVKIFYTHIHKGNVEIFRGQVVSGEPLCGSQIISLVRVNLEG